MSKVSGGFGHRHPRSALVAGEGIGTKSMTQQSFRDRANINNIVARWKRGQEIPEVKHGEPFYGDFTAMADYHLAMNRVAAAKSAFEALPAEVRSLCDNDPGLFVEMVQDPDMREELEELGVLKAPVDQVKTDELRDLGASTDLPEGVVHKPKAKSEEKPQDAAGGPAPARPAPEVAGGEKGAS